MDMIIRQAKLRGIDHLVDISINDGIFNTASDSANEQAIISIKQRSFFYELLNI